MKKCFYIFNVILMHLSSASPWVGGPRANAKLYGDLKGTLNDKFPM